MQSTPAPGYIAGCAAPRGFTARLSTAGFMWLVRLAWLAAFARH